MTIEQLLTKKGYTAQEIADLGPLLSNPKFRTDLEGELNSYETRATKAEADLNEYDRWFTEEITPEHQNLLKETADAKADAAAAKARFEAYQRTGMRKQAGQTAEEIAAAEKTERDRLAAEAGRNAIDTRYVAADTFNKAFSEAGTAIANAADLMEDHRELFGTRLNMTKEMEEAKAAKKPVRQYVEAKYDYAKKRTDAAQKMADEREAKIRLDERQKVMAAYPGSNPNLITPGPSSNPFVIRKRAEADKQPWEKNTNDLSRARIEGAIKKAVERGELATA